MRMGPRTVTLLALVALAPLTIGAQVNAPAGTMHDSIVTSAGVCRVWDVPPVNASFPDDASYNDCALDQRPKVLSRTLLALAPARGMWMHAHYVVIVEPNGSVNERLRDTELPTHRRDFWMRFATL